MRGEELGAMDVAYVLPNINECNIMVLVVQRGLDGSKRTYSEGENDYHELNLKKLALRYERGEDDMTWKQRIIYNTEDEGT